MDTDTYSPFAAQCFTWRGPGGQWTLTVVCKATFSLRPGLSPVLRESEPILADDRCEVEGGPVTTPSDLAPVKARADVVVVGSAFAPPGRQVTSVVARVAVETVDKSIRVVGPRSVMRSGSIREGASWTEMPIGFEQAGGGVGTWNPAGLAHDAIDRHGRRSLPLVEPPGWQLDLDVAVPPVGFGPIAPSWPSRKARLGEAHAKVFEPGWQERPFPADFDASFFQCAPDDQQLDTIPRGVAITLEHLHREAVQLETRLEAVWPSATVEARGRPSRSVVLRADTLVIDTDRASCTLTWRGHLSVDARDEDGLVTVCDEKDVSDEEDETRSPHGAQTAPSQRPQVAMDVEDMFEHTVTGDETLALPRALQPADPLPFRPVPSSQFPVLARLPMALATPQHPTASPPVLAVPEAPPSSFRGTIGQRVAPSFAAAAEAAPRSVVAVSTQPRVEAAPIELVWFDPAVVGRVRANKDLSRFVREVDPTPLDDEAKVRETRARADRATLSAVLARAELVTDVEGCVLASVTDDGALDPRLAVVGGMIEWSFDDVETLKIWTATAAALAPGDKRVKEVVDSANETLSTPLGGEPDVANGFVLRLRDAWVKAQKSLPNEYIDTHARRLLLSQRHYRRCTFADAEWIRGAISVEGAQTPIPVYVPSSAARSLPLFVRAPGRVLGDLVPQRDEAESSPVAIIVSALARVIAPKR
ncbi:MAG: DUF2169 domain-containing protein [Polyangiaceae bacterium]|nr:DUF2169 domain-containing protein [Polyangiaceae bacterium]